MTPADQLGTLCLACGMCCDGSLFGRVPLEQDEVAAARKNRLRVLPAGAAFEQPCSALGASRACAVYAERPRACRAFVCLTYERHRLEGGPLEPRLALVRRAHELLARASREDHAELTELLDAHFARAHPKAR